MASFVLRHKFLVIVAWVVLSIIAIRTVGLTGPRLDYTYATPGQPGFESNEKITRRFGVDATFESTLPILRLPRGVTMNTAEGQAMARRVFAAGPSAGPLALADYATTHDPKFILDGGAATWALIILPNPDIGPHAGMEHRVEPALRAATPAGATLTVTGFAQMLSNAGPNAENMAKGVMFGAALALVVLFVVYGSPIAVLPILVAIPAMCVTFLCVLALTYVTHVSYFVQYMIVLLSLGLSIDFSLIVVIRWREERERGRANSEAVAAAMRSAGRAVALSGLTAAVGLLSLVVLPVPFLRSVGFGAMLIPLVAVCVALTLLPALLALVGPALDRFCIWPRASTTYSRPWERWGAFVLRHQWKAAAMGLLLIALTTAPAFSMKTGQPLIGSLSQAGPAAEAFHVLQRHGVPSGVDFPIYIMTHGGAAAVSRATAIARATPGVYDVLAPDTPSFRRGDDALMVVIPRVEGSRIEGKAIVSTLRTRLAGVSGGAADVGGSTAGEMALTDAIVGGLPLLLTLVSLVTMVILIWSLRSPVLALKAVILNVVSLGSAFGFMVFFWQQGHGSSLIFDMPATSATRTWIPVVIFASLFGLSMDYEVFVLSRIREEYLRTGSTRQAVVGGLARTGRLVTCAALILMVTFLALSIDPNQLVKTTSTTLAVGVIVDAVVIRALLVPALVSLMGRWNWWMPAVLTKLPPPGAQPAVSP